MRRRARDIGSRAGPRERDGSFDRSREPERAWSRGPRRPGHSRDGDRRYPAPMGKLGRELGGARRRAPGSRHYYRHADDYGSRSCSRSRSPARGRRFAGRFDEFGPPTRRRPARLDDGWVGARSGGGYRTSYEDAASASKGSRHQGHELASRDSRGSAGRGGRRGGAPGSAPLPAPPRASPGSGDHIHCGPLYGRQRDYADEKPEAYSAFLGHVRYVRGPFGVDWEVYLCDRMCLDHHVDDLLRCLEAWLSRETGPPPWRLGRLDLSRNGLSDASLARVLAQLKRMDVRVGRLDLDSNLAGTVCLKMLVEYLWNNPEAMADIGLTGNQLEVQPSTSGDDPMSNLLRCIYNHPAYPRKIQAVSPGTPPLTMPLILRVGGNRIHGLEQILGQVLAKVGGKRARFCSSPEAYACRAQEYLSVFVQGNGQAGITVASHAAPPVPAIGDTVGQCPPAGATAAEFGASESAESGSCSESEESVVASYDGYDVGSPPDEDGRAEEAQEDDVGEAAAAPEARASGRTREGRRRPPLHNTEHRASGEGGCSAPVEDFDAVRRKKRKRRRRNVGADMETVPADSPGEEDDGGMQGADGLSVQSEEGADATQSDVVVEDLHSLIDSALDEQEQRLLQEHLVVQLDAMPGMPKEKETQAMLAELIVCMLVSRKGVVEVIGELEPFLGEQNAATFVASVGEVLRRGFFNGNQKNKAA